MHVDDPQQTGGTVGNINALGINNLAKISQFLEMNAKTHTERDEAHGQLSTGYDRPKIRRDRANISPTARTQNTNVQYTRINDIPIRAMVALCAIINRKVFSSSDSNNTSYECGLQSLCRANNRAMFVLCLNTRFGLYPVLARV